jgi:hypothetical protein
MDFLERQTAISNGIVGMPATCLPGTELTASYDVCGGIITACGSTNDGT